MINSSEETLYSAEKRAKAVIKCGARDKQTQEKPTSYDTFLTHDSEPQTSSNNRHTLAHVLSCRCFPNFSY